MTSSLGPWEPLGLAAAIDLFGDAPFRWWVSGGHALELHAQRSWRSHDDIDIGICRNDAARLPTVLVGWDVHVAAAGELTPWRGTAPNARRHENNLWARPSPTAPWALDLTLSDGDDADWVYRRDPSVRRPWPDAVLTTADGTPYLAPELQMLFKSTNVRPKDRLDAREILPTLDADRAAWLLHALPPDHEWRRDLE